MQLLTHWQWWSKPSTHLLQIKQWRDSGVHITSQVGQRLLGSNLSTSVRKGTVLGFWMYPGSLWQVRVNRTLTIMKSTMIDLTRKSSSGMSEFSSLSLSAYRAR